MTSKEASNQTPQNKLLQNDTDEDWQDFPKTDHEATLKMNKREQNQLQVDDNQANVKFSSKSGCSSTGGIDGPKQQNLLLENVINNSQNQSQQQQELVDEQQADELLEHLENNNNNDDHQMESILMDSIRLQQDDQDSGFVTSNEISMIKHVDRKNEQYLYDEKTLHDKTNVNDLNIMTGHLQEEFPSFDVQYEVEQPAQDSMRIVHHVSKVDMTRNKSNYAGNTNNEKDNTASKTGGVTLSTATGNHSIKKAHRFWEVQPFINVGSVPQRFFPLLANSWYPLTIDQMAELQMMPLRDRALISKQKVVLKNQIMQIDLKGRLQGSSTIWLFTRVYNESPQEGCVVIRFKKKKQNQNLIVSVGSIRKVRRIVHKDGQTHHLSGSMVGNDSALGGMSNASKQSIQISKNNIQNTKECEIFFEYRYQDQMKVPDHGYQMFSDTFSLIPVNQQIIDDTIDFCATVCDDGESQVAVTIKTGLSEQVNLVSRADNDALKKDQPMNLILAGDNFDYSYAKDFTVCHQDRKSQLGLVRPGITKTGANKGEDCCAGCSIF